MSEPRVQNKRWLGARGLERTVVYVGRPSKWGNPFVIGRDGTREEVVEKYRRWIQTQPHLLQALPELTGADLVCWCAPLPCHADVLLELARLLDE